MLDNNNKNVPNNSFIELMRLAFFYVDFNEIPVDHNVKITDNDTFKMRSDPSEFWTLLSCSNIFKIIKIPLCGHVNIYT